MAALLHESASANASGDREPARDRQYAVDATMGLLMPS
jgi:hypothetical protein